MSIESKLDEVMAEKNFSVDQLIEKTGLPRMTIYNARKGANLTLKTALSISEALDVKLEDIWSREALEEEEVADVYAC